MPACPQTRITGIPGAGLETRTANEFLADAQHELDNALAVRDRQAPELDATVARDAQALAAARQSVVADAGRGLGARWVAMNELTFASTGALALRLLTIALFALLYLLPLILRQWRGETTHDRHATARAYRERAELEADIAIAIKRAEVRREAEIIWAEHQLTQTRLAVEAQIEIDREQQRRRVVEALEGPARASSERAFEPVEEKTFLPIAAEAEAAGRGAAELPAGPEHARGGTQHVTPLIPSIPDATRAAARWIRPLVPPLVARVIDNTAAPLRSARQVFEDVEEIAFSFKRTRKITVDTESSGMRERPPTASPPAEVRRIQSSRAERGRPSQGDDDQRYDHLGADKRYSSLLIGRDRPHELRSPEGPRQLPPAE